MAKNQSNITTTAELDAKKIAEKSEESLEKSKATLLQAKVRDAVEIHC